MCQEKDYMNKEIYTLNPHHQENIHLTCTSMYMYEDN
jgi:hypothetical protein